jgi:hypothetical protein
MQRKSSETKSNLFFYFAAKWAERIIFEGGEFFIIYLQWNFLPTWKNFTQNGIISFSREVLSLLGKIFSFKVEKFHFHP